MRERSARCVVPPPLSFCLRSPCWNVIAEWERLLGTDDGEDDAQSEQGLEEGTADVKGAPRVTRRG
jgi:hypothetical protein